MAIHSVSPHANYELWFKTLITVITEPVETLTKSSDISMETYIELSRGGFLE